MPINAWRVSWSVFWRTLRFAALLIATTFAAPALADDWESCAKSAGDEAIAACTRAIKSGTYNGRTLALAHSNRGVEWKAKGELAKAIADYDEAVKNDPLTGAKGTGKTRGITDTTIKEVFVGAVRYAGSVAKLLG